MNRLEIATGPSVTVRSIADFAERLRDARSADHLVIDTSALDEADLAFVQLVEVARRDASLSGNTIQISAPANERLRALLVRCGYMTSASPEELAFWLQGEPFQ
jgi:hypothetical protein